MPNKSPAFQIYPESILRDLEVKLMSNREFGVYMKLILHSWLENGLPEEADSLSNIANEDPRDFEPIWSKIAKKFKRRKVGQAVKLVSQGVEKQRRKQKKRAKVMRQVAKKMWKNKNRKMTPKCNRNATEMQQKVILPSKPIYIDNYIDTYIDKHLPSTISQIKDTFPAAEGLGKKEKTVPPDKKKENLSDSLKKEKLTPLEKKESLAPNGATATPSRAPPYGAPKTDLQKLVLVWKLLSGVEREDRAWDKVHWGRSSAAAANLLDVFKGDVNMAADCMAEVHESLTKANMTFTLETICRHAHDWKGKNAKV